MRWLTSWWRHQMEAFPALPALCAGNSSVTGDFSAQRPATRSFDVFFDLRLNKRLSEQSWGWWFDTPSCSLWREFNVIDILPCGIPFPRGNTGSSYTTQTMAVDDLTSQGIRAPAFPSKGSPLIRWDGRINIAFLELGDHIVFLWMFLRKWQTHRIQRSIYHSTTTTKVNTRHSLSCQSIYLAPTSELWDV